MAKTIKAACIQLNSGPDIAENLKTTSELIREAAGAGAQLIATPENTCHMVFPFSERLKSASEQDSHPCVSAYSSLANELQIWLLIGSISIKIGSEMLANRSFLFSPSGEVAATYDKIHMFDVDLPGGESYQESKYNQPGDKAVVADIGDAKLGLSICYDLRFAHLYRDLAKAGAEILAVPSAFTVPTGKAHWEVLLRARAIETGSFVLAPGQVGEHVGGRKTYGHSMIIGPWGEILGEIDTDIGIMSADLDLEEVTKARAAIPALLHDRDYEVVS